MVHATLNGDCNLALPTTNNQQLIYGRQFISLRFLSSCFSFQSFSLPEKDKEKGFPLQSGAGSNFFSFGLLFKY